MVDDLNAVTRYLKKYHKPDDPIPTKSQERVLKTIASGIRRNPKLAGGNCHTCGIIMEHLVPVPLKVCSGCKNHFTRKSGFSKVIKKEFLANSNCDWCLGRAFTIYHINPFVCVRCSRKTGRRHKFDLQEMRFQKMRALRRRPW